MSCVPCKYETGKTLGIGTYAVVKEATNSDTGEVLACKIISKRLLKGREHLILNEVDNLRRLSDINTNVTILRDYFETPNNFYMCFDRYEGGELLDKIRTQGRYTELATVDMIRSLFTSVQDIHAAGIVHHDLKPENFIFRTAKEGADLVIVDFGLSEFVGDKQRLLTDVTGTDGYMAPEVYLQGNNADTFVGGHGKPVDVFAMGVVTYFLLAGHRPFSRETLTEERAAVIAGDYQFEPPETWDSISDAACDFVSKCLNLNPKRRPTATQALEHEWLAVPAPAMVLEASDNEPTIQHDLPHVQPTAITSTGHIEELGEEEAEPEQDEPDKEDKSETLRTKGIRLKMDVDACRSSHEKATHLESTASHLAREKAKKLGLLNSLPYRGWMDTKGK